jgi:hypothetical protein
MPIVREPLDPKLSMWHFLAYYLRFIREKEGLSLTQWGRIIGAARSSVSNMEAGRHRLQDEHAAIIDRHFGLGRLFQMLLWYARMAHDPEWAMQYVRYEKQANLIRIWHGQAIPLPLQTDAYTEAYAQELSTGDLDAVMARRITRKRDVIEREDPPDLWVVVDEAAMARQVGGPETMKGEYEHLLELSYNPRVIFRVVPFDAGAHLGTDGTLHLLSLDSRDVVYAGAHNGGRLIETPGEVRELSVRFDRIGAKAASVDASREILKRYLERYT